MYLWKRFWCPRTGTLNLTDGGYLVDPEANRALLADSDTVPFEDISSVQCLILLGEPGMGKSSSMRAEYEAVTGALAATPDRAFWLDLHEVGSDIQLNRELVDAPEITAWRDGNYSLHLFLDSFDECRMQIKNLVPRLLKELRRWPVERLYLRVASRTADWPPTLEEDLHQFWSDDKISTFELAPLRRRDVNMVALQRGWDAEMFQAAISGSGAVPLAIKPLTLDFLARAYSETRTLPGDPLELYRKGMRLLCEETERRRELDLPQRLDGQRRIVVAERLAAITVLANRGAVWNDVDRGDVPQDDVLVSQVADSDEQPGDAAFAIDESAVKEVLSTSLFSSRGPRRLGWAHQSYAEFLAAAYLARTNLPISQICQLLLDPGDQRLVPQLRGTAAWLAAMRSDVLHELISQDPEVMLRNAASSLNEPTREALVAALLQRFGHGQLIDRNREHWAHYHRLKHPNLARQLRPYLVEQQHNWVVRCVAIDIAEACDVYELVNDLIEIALAHDEDIEIRVNAAYAVTKIGTVEDRGRLTPLIYVAPNDDPNDELKGCGLRASWPEHLTSDGLFAILTPFRSDLFGAYKSFVYSELAQKLPLAGLPRALQWAADEIEKDHLLFEFQNLIDDLLGCAWEHLDDPHVLSALAPAVLARARNYEDAFGRRGDPETQAIFNESDEKRRQLLATVLPLAAVEDLHWLVWSTLVRNSDLMWILGQLTTVSESEKRSWAALLPLVLDYQNVDQLDAVLEARENDEVVREFVSPYFDPIPLGSQRAQRERNCEEQAKRWQVGEAERAALAERLRDEVAKRISAYLSQFDEGNLQAWWQLNFELAVDPTRQVRESEFEFDITSLPGWTNLTPRDRSRIIEAAERYVREQVPSENEWLGTDTIYRPDWAGYRALHLLWQEAPDHLASLPAAVWEAWAAVVIGVRTLNSHESASAQQPLVLLAYQHAPDRVLTALDLVMERASESQGPDIESILGRVEDCWDDRLARILLNRVNDHGLTPRTRGCILQALLSHGALGARAVAEETLRLPLSAEVESRELAVQATLSLIRETDDAGWTVVWPAMQSDPEYGEQVVERLTWDD